LKLQLRVSLFSVNTIKETGFRLSDPHFYQDIIRAKLT